MRFRAALLAALLTTATLPAWAESLVHGGGFDAAPGDGSEPFLAPSGPGVGLLPDSGALPPLGSLLNQSEAVSPAVKGKKGATAPAPTSPTGTPPALTPTAPMGQGGQDDWFSGAGKMQGY